MKPLKMSLIASIVTLFLVCIPTLAADLAGKIEKVVVYRGQALVTRGLDIELSAGSSKIVVTNLPPAILPESIHAKTKDSVKVLSVRYRQRAVPEDTREQVKELDQQIKKLERQIYHNERKKGHLDNQWAMFIKLRDFVVEAKHLELNKGLLDFEPIKNLTNHIQQKGQEYIEQVLQYEDQIDDLKEKLELAKQKRAKLKAGRSRTIREAVLYLYAESKTQASLTISYLVSDASWSPQYNLRAKPDRQSALIEYNALINQTSGENWDNVSVSLSTAQPAMVASPPTLKPLTATLIDYSQPQSRRQQTQAVQRDQKEAGSIFRERAEQAKKGKEVESKLNTLAQQSQSLILTASREEAMELQQQWAEIARTEGISVTYQLPGKLSIPSRNEQQLAGIASIDAPAEFTLLASPLLTDYVYLQAKLSNESDIIFLQGPATMFRDGRFVGKGHLPLVTKKQTFTTGFGIDSQVQVKRELVDKETRIQWGNRKDTYTYRIALNNYHSSAVKLKLLDRLPYTMQNNLKIELENAEPQLSEDPEYLRTQRKKGILRWDIELEPDTTGREATVIKYTYSMEYDKSMRINTR